jgi:LysM repeat protein
MSDKNDDSLKDGQNETGQDESQDTEASTQASRGEFHKKKRNTKNIMGSLIWVIIILAIGSLAYYMTQKQDFLQNTGNTTTTQVAKSSSDKAKSSKKKVSSKSNSAKSESKSSEAKTSSSKSSSSKVKSSSESTSSASVSSVEVPSSSQSSATGASYARVEAGQGLYRVAVNNGISVQKLMELNGLSSSSDIEPGQQLRVR